jgi:hypothetical protein
LAGKKCILADDYSPSAAIGQSRKSGIDLQIVAGL